MGHVVEGILATYSPYYIPAPVEIYFLEDFRKLQDELPHVRPTVFFSVPRIYERVWEALEKKIHSEDSTSKQRAPYSNEQSEEFLET